MTRRVAWLCGFAALCFGAGLTAAHFSGGTAQAQENQTLGDYPLERFREFVEAFDIIQKNYVDEVSGDQLMEDAIRGMISGLDPHSAYLPERALGSFERSISAEEYGGVGFYVGEKNGWIEVISPIDDTPAARAGLMPGDLVIKIDGETTSGMGVTEAVNLMRGKVGEPLTLEVLSSGSQEPRTVDLIRERITAPTSFAGLAEPDFGYLRLNRFQRQTVEDVVKNLNRMYAENERPLRGLILDLRNNPGGLLGSSIGVAGIFLPPGATVVTDRGRDREHPHVASSEYYYGLENLEEIKKLRLAVLVNNGSASASEIVAGALQDHKRGIIIGTSTYGKASVQSLLRLRETGQKSGLKLTTARYYTPSDRSIQAVGIKPDVEVAAAPSVETEENFSLTEKDLAGHLEGEEEETGDAEEDESSNPFIPQDDHQYDQALIILKAMAAISN